MTFFKDTPYQLQQNIKWDLTTKVSQKDLPVNDVQIWSQTLSGKMLIKFGEILTEEFLIGKEIGLHLKNNGDSVGQ